MTFDAKPEENMFPLEHRGEARYAPPWQPLSLHAVTSPLAKRIKLCWEVVRGFFWK